MHGKTEEEILADIRALKEEKAYKDTAPQAKVLLMHILGHCVYESAVRTVAYLEISSASSEALRSGNVQSRWFPVLPWPATVQR